MMERIAEASPRRWARIAGGLYLTVIVGGFFAVGFVPAAIVVAGDAAATAHNILGNELFYRLGLVAHIIILPFNMSLLVVFFTLVGTAIEGANLLNQFAPLILLEGGRYSSVFSAGQLQALAYMPLELQLIGFNLALVFFGFYCLSIGYLVFRSTFLPRIVGVLMAIGGLCYLTNSFAYFLAPGFAASLFPYIQVPSLIGEGSLTLSLIVIGVNVQRWKERASAAGDWRS